MVVVGRWVESGECGGQRCDGPGALWSRIVLCGACVVGVGEEERQERQVGIAGLTGRGEVFLVSRSVGIIFVFFLERWLGTYTHSLRGRRSIAAFSTSVKVTGASSGADSRWGCVHARSSSICSVSAKSALRK